LGFDELEDKEEVVVVEVELLEPANCCA